MLSFLIEPYYDQTFRNSAQMGWNPDIFAWEAFRQSNLRGNSHALLPDFFSTSKIRLSGYPIPVASVVMPLLRTRLLVKVTIYSHVFFSFQ